MKGSVRSLPPRRMQNIRQMFEGQDNQDNQTTELKESAMEGEPDSYVKATQSKFETENSGSPTTRWRQHITQPRVLSEADKSPTRKLRINKSPSRPADQLAGFPVPSPRQSIKKKNSVEESEPGLADLSITKFGNIASIVADVGDDSSSCGRVSKLINQYKGSNNESNVKQSADTVAGSSPSKTPLPVPAIANRRAVSPEKSKLTAPETKPHVRFADQKTVSCNLSVPSHVDDKRPVSVSERSRLFEKISGSSVPSPSAVACPASQKPAKPPPPVRQRSFTEGSAARKTSTGEKIPPKRPPMRQRSISEKENEMNITSPKETRNESKSQKMPMKPPAPPSKPQRTFAHDDYMKVKLEKQTEPDRIMSQSAHADLGPENADDEEELDTVIIGTKKLKPSRPPPPKKKQRPFSIATDKMIDLKSSDGSDSDSSKKSVDSHNGMFYESVEANLKDSDHMIKHWDLPRMSHPEPIRRSLSDDCIHKAVDNEGELDLPFD